MSGAFHYVQYSGSTEAVLVSGSAEIRLLVGLLLCLLEHTSPWQLTLLERSNNTASFSALA